MCAIAAILAAVAVPAYRAQLERAYRIDGQLKLFEVMDLQNRHFARHKTYTDKLIDQLGASATNGRVLSERGHYAITAAPCGSGLGECVRLTATPVEAGETMHLESSGRRLPASAWR